MSNLHSSTNSSASNIPDESDRDFEASYSGQSGEPSPAFHHSGNIQGLHNIHESYSAGDMPGILSSRNTSMNNIPSPGIQQPNASISGGKFTSNSLPVPLSQLSHGNPHPHSEVTSRGGINVVEVSQIMGNAGPWITTSMGNMVGGGNMVSSVGGLSIPGLASQLNLTTNSGLGINIHGQNQMMGGVIPEGSLRKQSAGVAPMIQQNHEFNIQNEDFPALPGFKGSQVNSHLSPVGPLTENHVQPVNSLMLNEHSNESSLFDMNNDYPKLSSRSDSACGSLRKQSAGVAPMIQQNHEFNIQNEDFPALPGFKGSAADYPTVLHNKEQRHDNAKSMMPSQHFSTGRSTGLILGGGYSSTCGLQGLGLRPLTPPTIPEPKQECPQHQNPDMKMTAPAHLEHDRYGLLAFLDVLRMSNRELTLLALGVDPLTLGLDLISRKSLYKTFASPWSNEPTKVEREFSVPECYYAVKSPSLRLANFSSFTLVTLFYIFYSMPKDDAQLLAADELHNRRWFYHKSFRLWFMETGEPPVKTSSSERGTYYFFDPKSFKLVRKEDFLVQYGLLEDRPTLT